MVQPTEAISKMETKMVTASRQCKLKTILFVGKTVKALKAFGEKENHMKER